jgi:hypothetical protein
LNLTWPDLPSAVLIVNVIVESGGTRSTLRGNLSRRANLPGTVLAQS